MIFFFLKKNISKLSWKLDYEDDYYEDEYYEDDNNDSLTANDHQEDQTKKIDLIEFEKEQQAKRKALEKLNVQKEKSFYFWKLFLFFCKNWSYFNFILNSQWILVFLQFFKKSLRKKPPEQFEKLINQLYKIYTNSIQMMLNQNDRKKLV